MFWQDWYTAAYPDQREAPGMDQAIFTCKLCGKNHLSTNFGTPNQVDEQTKAALKAAWQEAEEKFSKSPQNEHLERAYMKAWFAYAQTLSNNKLALLPTTITTARSKGEYYFLCTDHEQAKEKSKDPKPATKSCGNGNDCGGHGQEANLQG